MAFDLLAAMRVFTTVADTGSFAAAAERLSLSRAMASRHVALLEQHLNTRLMHRTTRRLSLTEAGVEYHQRSTQVLALVQEAGDVAGRHAAKPAGLLRVATSIGFGQQHLEQAVLRFLRQHPGVQVELQMGEARVNLVEEGFDLAVRVATQVEPGMVARRLARVRILLAAAPAYLAKHGTPHKPSDLAAHNCLVYAHKDWRSEWNLRNGGKLESVPIAGDLRASAGTLLVGAAIAGHGIVLEPEFLLHDALRRGQLVRVLPPWHGGELTLSAVYPERRHLPLKVRAFVDFLAQAFGDPPYWEAWEKPPPGAGAKRGARRRAA